MYIARLSFAAGMVLAFLVLQTLHVVVDKESGGPANSVAEIGLNAWSIKPWNLTEARNRASERRAREDGNSIETGKSRPLTRSLTGA